MVILVLFAFLAGVVTLLSPCILPILPIILSGSVIGGKKRPWGVVIGFILSFTFFTLFLATVVRVIGIPADSLRTFSIVVIFVFGLSLFLPVLRHVLERLLVRFSTFSPRLDQESGFWGGVLVGVSIGLVWTPCVGPILASVISLALTGTVTSSAVIITLAYATGTALPMLAIVYGGRNLLVKVPWLVNNTARIQQMFGLLMILTAVAIFFNYDRKFQAYVLDKFPNYGVGLTKIEDNPLVQQELDVGRDKEEDMGKPLYNFLPNEGRAPEIIPGGQWFNLPEDEQSLTMTGLRGKVVLIDFWTYTCINCIRTLPYLRSWHEKYADDGLVIIGVHAPEFEFEKSAENLAKAIQDFDLKYPIVQDNNFDTWNAYKNHYWPAKYLVDKQGNVRFHHFGEGEYDKTEELIQKLLDISGEINNPRYKVQSRTPELYLGTARIAYFASNERWEKDKQVTYSFPMRLNLNRFAYEGDWTITEEYSQPQENARLKLRFQAKDVFLVMRPKNANGQVGVYLNDKKVDTITVDSDRLYELIKLDRPGDHVLMLEFLDSNLEIFAFTFG